MSSNSKPKIAVALSGGVDSSVAAFLLKKKGYDVFGVFAKFWSKEDGEKVRENICCSKESRDDAKRVCDMLGIPFYVVNLQMPFKEKVVDNFLLEYNAGKTPNPCVRCNQFIKFGELLDKVEKLGATHLATGHYSQVKKKGDQYHLYKGKDKEKDQSYFLYRLNQKQLSKIMFPVGHLTKPKVRKIAAKNGLPTAAKRESQEVCFVPSGDLQEFLADYLELKPGEIKDIDSKKVLGEHKGLALYTIGQRKGIGLAGGPYFVVEKDDKDNVLYVTKDKNHEKLKFERLKLKNIQWLAGTRDGAFPLKCTAKIRYASPETAVVISKDKDGYFVEFKKPQWAVTPGQSIVFWKGKEVLGGTVI
ncbi:MAG TPA: tRNA 2-thiouridine(34) synthase MnmA [Candidatus Bipolaricaulota bacterium]|nr:tRNA 2-thiouridine(34) synthase MnmA [Candidatus Bipolaricaulota bacterium]